jgi:hypothetical protein
LWHMHLFVSGGRTQPMLAPIFLRATFRSSI